MAFTKEKEELWVSENHCIDVIDVKNFMVDTSKNINLRILNESCGIDTKLNVVQMVRSVGRVWCLLKNSPYILEFCENSYNCMSLLTCEKEMLYKENVRKLLEFDDSIHATYHTLQRTELSSDSDDEGGYVGPMSASGEANPFQDDCIYQDPDFDKVAEDCKQKRRIAATRKALSTVDNSQNEAPSVPERTAAPLIPRRTTVTSTSHPISQQSDAPPVPQRINRLPVPDITQLRASTLPNTRRSQSQSSCDSQNSVRSRPLSGPPLPPKPSLSPTSEPYESGTLFQESVHESDSHLNDFSIIIKCIESVGNSIWVSRSKGDICVIDIRLPTTAGQSNCGKVVAVLENKLRKSSTKSEEEVKLKKVGKYVVSTYSEKGEDTLVSGTEVAVWDALDAGDMERIQSYWGRIIYIEKKISNDTKEVADNVETVFMRDTGDHF